MGVSFAIPKTGIRFNKKDISEIFALEVEGKAFLDFGSKNDLTPENINALIKNNKISAPEKIITFLSAVREFSFTAHGSFTLALEEITEGMLPDLIIAEDLKLNFLMNFGTGPDGDKGSSGMQPGVHFLLHLPPINIIGDFIGFIVNILTKVLKIGNFPTPQLPGIPEIEMGFTLGEAVGFKFAVTGFSISCVIKTVGGFGISCKLGLDFLTIMKDLINGVGKWIGKMGKKLFDEAGKAFMAIDAFLGGLGIDVGAGAKAIFNGLKNVAKAAWNGAKKAVDYLKNKTKKAIADLGKALGIDQKHIDNINNFCKNQLKNIGNFFSSSISKLGSAINDFGKAIFAPGKYKKEKARKKEAKRLLEVKRDNEKNAAAAKAAKEIEDVKRRMKEESEKGEKDITNCEIEEVKGEQNQWRKNLAYHVAAQNLIEL